MILHEISHDKRVAWASQNNYPKFSSKNLIEVTREFYETFVFKSRRIDTVEQQAFFKIKATECLMKIKNVWNWATCLEIL